MTSCLRCPLSQSAKVHGAQQLQGLGIHPTSHRAQEEVEKAVARLTADETFETDDETIALRCLYHLLAYCVLIVLLLVLLMLRFWRVWLLDINSTHEKRSICRCLTLFWRLWIALFGGILNVVWKESAYQVFFCNMYCKWTLNITINSCFSR